MAVRINLEGAVRYLNAVAVGKLDGLQQELAAKAAELGVEPGKIITPDTQVGQEPTGNVAGILRFVRECGSGTKEQVAEQKAQLGTLLAVVTARTGAQGLKVGATAGEGGAPVGPRGRRRRRKQR